MDQLLTLLSADARLTNAQLAAALSISEEEVAARIADYEERKIIKGYKAIVDWDKTDRDYVNARIELKVTPQKGMGFEEIAGIIARFDEVESASSRACSAAAEPERSSSASDAETGRLAVPAITERISLPRSLAPSTRR